MDTLSGDSLEHMKPIMDKLALDTQRAAYLRVCSIFGDVNDWRFFHDLGL